MEIFVNRSKEEEIIFQHYIDQIDKAYQRNIPIFSRFASFRQIELGFTALESFYGRGAVYSGKQYLLYGGYPDAERQMFCFIGDGNIPVESDFPISCIQIAPANKRFCETLTHRDYLGTIMGLGITREQIGDILVEKDNVHQACTAYVFCVSDKKDLILKITRIKHTTVMAREIPFEYSGFSPSFKEIVGSISSFRLDAILSLAIKTSRSQSLLLIREGNVMIQGRVCTDNAKKLQENDVISIRGYGKFIFVQSSSPSKKGRFRVTLQQYI